MELEDGYSKHWNLRTVQVAFLKSMDGRGEERVIRNDEGKKL